MGEREKHVPGTLSWVDLGTTDADGAKGFYGALFGWEFEDMPIEDDAVYSMARIGGRDVAALYSQREEQRAQGVPPNWLSYVTVEDANAAAAKAGELGGTAMGEPFDVFQAGRMALVQDPTGAVFAIWQPRESIGAGLVNAHGALTMNQLNTSDPERAGEFYSGLFGWRVEAVDSPAAPYWGLYNGDTLNAGMMTLPEGAEAPSHWLVYFAVDDLDRAAGQIAELGGQVMVPPMAIPAGRFLVARDPQGAYFALFAGRLDP